jgi:hypothetical protein
VLAHVHPSPCRFAPGLVPASRCDHSRLNVRESTWNRQVPRAPLPPPGVTRASVASSATSEDVTPLSSLIRAHASDQLPPASFGCPSFGGSLQVAASPCWSMALPDVISADLSLDAWTCPTVVREVPMAVTSLPASAFPELCQRVGNQQRSASNDFMQVPISRAVVIPYVQASRFACHPGRPHRCGSRPQGGRGVEFRAERDLLPPHASDLLAVRIGQLTARGLAPRKIRSLVGCSQSRGDSRSGRNH